MVSNPDFTPDERRDPFRTPMQWDNTQSAGFSANATTWLPVHQNYQQLNVAAEKAANRSHYHHFKELTALRKEATFIHGDLRTKTLNKDVLALTRLVRNILFLMLSCHSLFFILGTTLDFRPTSCWSTLEVNSKRSI